MPHTALSASAEIPDSGNTRAIASAQVRNRLADSGREGIQLSLEDMGLPLDEVTWIVLDVETTGLGRADEITEIGAVKMSHGTIIDEFSTMVDPRKPIPPRITALTGITPSMVAGAPTIDAALPSFLS